MKLKFKNKSLDNSIRIQIKPSSDTSTIDLLEASVKNSVMIIRDNLEICLAKQSCGTCTENPKEQGFTLLNNESLFDVYVGNMDTPINIGINAQEFFNLYKKGINSKLLLEEPPIIDFDFEVLESEKE